MVTRSTLIWPLSEGLGNTQLHSRHLHEGEPAPDPSEVDGWRWIDLDELRTGLRREPEQYSYWLRIAVENDYWLKPSAIPTGG